MNKQHRFTILIILVFTVLVTACGRNPAVPATDNPSDTPTESPTDSPTVTALPSITNTPDPCAHENIESEVQKVHKYMREFDDASSLAASLPADQLADAIANLQRIRREAEDQPTPTCLINLKTYQISHMNLVIGTLINLIGYANGTVDKQVIDQGIALARQEHDNYTIELARVLGITMVPAAGITPPAQTPSP